MKSSTDGMLVKIRFMVIKKKAPILGDRTRDVDEEWKGLIFIVKYNTYSNIFIPVIDNISQVALSYSFFAQSEVHKPNQ